jgi:F420-non-reducing hydrogenase small subunit
VSIVDLHEKILDVFKAVELVHSPVLVDTKDYPDADIGILTGAIRTDHDRDVAEKMRKSCKTLIAFGTCAVYGGISGAGFVHKNEDIFHTVYKENPTTHNDEILPDPAKGIPALEETVVPVDEAIQVDLYLAGCPPNPYYIFEAINALIGKKSPSQKRLNVCGTCKREMRKNKDVDEIKRSFEGDIDDKVCFLSQGYLCFGSVTLERCRMACPNMGVICTGCSGPSIQVLQEPNRDIRTEIADRMSELTSIPRMDIIHEIQKNSKTHYAYAMASNMIGKKPTFLIKNWIRERVGEPS